MRNFAAPGLASPPLPPSIPLGCPLQPGHPNTIWQAGPAVATGRWRLLVVSGGPVESVGAGGVCRFEPGARNFLLVFRTARSNRGRGDLKVRTGRSNVLCFERPVRITVVGICRFERDVRIPPPARATKPPKHNQASMVSKTAPISSTTFNALFGASPPPSPHLI